MIENIKKDNYEKSHNLLLHLIHYQLKRLNDLYLAEFNEIYECHKRNNELVEECLNSPTMNNAYKQSLFSEPNIQPHKDVRIILESLYPVLDIARKNFSHFNKLFDWIESKQDSSTIVGDACWCIGCINIRTIVFEERPELKIDSQPVSLSNGDATHKEIKNFVLSKNI